MRIFFFLSFILFLVNCDSSNDHQLVYNEKINNLQTEVFTLPDSIDSKLIIASCQHWDFGVQTIFMYSDSSKKMARRIDYINDSTSNADDLEILKLNEFHSKHYNVDYIIEDKTVSMISRRNNHGFGTPESKTFRRTDRD